MTARVLLFTLLLATPLAARADDLILLLQQRNCPDCRLADVDLVHADLRDADLSGAQLQRANLSQARLDGADLRNTDLRFTSLRGASLRGADLRGSKLYGTDLRLSDLSGAVLDPDALEQSHWQGARGIASGIRSHASLHNAGVDAAEKGQWEKAEKLFGEAIKAKPEDPLSWVARGLSRGELGQSDLAAKDLAYAGTLFSESGDQVKAEQLELASKKTRDPQTPSTKSGTGIGSTILSGGLSVLQIIGPMALRALSPL
ncbi:hypothetical protein KR52_03615 [Synechococcus sp. KORDI-52]|uniref:pentapeptide repeat-containing protein n=1 Tax=Synechococcus sp. KORDI-52 TaxID=585425 RepID=UPI0004E04C59|nr:pentapeptide repeat-containing protein [Synechococcus sp. KORDI-52]AII48243.1 hypothetical protein KR52_03615 [Synechococcus sp. KORDI-52]